MPCARCQQPLDESDPGWPDKLGTICTGCWEAECGELWWAMIDAIGEMP